MGEIGRRWGWLQLGSLGFFVEMSGPFCALDSQQEQGDRGGDVEELGQQGSAVGNKFVDDLDDGYGAAYCGDDAVRAAAVSGAAQGGQLADAQAVEFVFVRVGHGENSNLRGRLAKRWGGA